MGTDFTEIPKFPKILGGTEHAQTVSTGLLFFSAHELEQYPDALTSQ